MPTYEYECKKCGKRFERFQQISAKPLSKCPDCKGKVRRLISGGGGIIFKGSGFYETDYKRKKKPPVTDRSASEKDSKTEKKGSGEKSESAGSSSKDKKKDS